MSNEPRHLNPVPPAPESSQEPLSPEELSWWRRWLHRRFGTVSFSRDKLAAIAALPPGAQIIYVCPELGRLDYRFFEYFLAKNQLPPCHYARSLRRTRFWRRRPKPSEQHDLSRHLRELLEHKKSYLIQLRLSALYDDSLWANPRTDALRISLEHASPNTYFVPLQLLWGSRPETTQLSLRDTLFGTAANPRSLRKGWRFLRGLRGHASCVIGEPVSLQQLRESQQDSASGQVSTRQVREYFARHFARWRKSFTGPKLAPRRWMIEQCLEADAVERCIYESAQLSRRTPEDVRELCTEYLREIACDINYTMIELASRLVQWALTHFYDGIVYDEADIERLREAVTNGPVIFVPNHRSHIDTFILSHVLYRHNLALPVVAAGINMAFWPAGPLFRKCGAFFLRRRFANNPLYRACFATYLHHTVRHGHSMVFFIEGGRSRTGKSLKPRLGMLSMLGDAWREQHVQDLQFIPVNITHERILEHGAHIREIQGAKKIKESLWSLFRARKLFTQRHGKIYVRFAAPLSYAAQVTQQTPCRQASEMTDEHKSTVTRHLADTLMHGIHEQAVVTPAALVATSLLSDGYTAITTSNFQARMKQLRDFLQWQGAPLAHELDAQFDNATTAALQQLIDNKQLQRADRFHPEHYHFTASTRLGLDLQKNSIVHYLVPVACVSTLLLSGTQQGRRYHLDQLWSDLALCSQVFAHEFKMPKDDAVRSSYDPIINYLESTGCIRRDVGSQHFEVTQAAPLIGFHNCLRNFWEAYQLAWDTCEACKTACSEADLVDMALQYGEHQLRLSQVFHPEALSTIVFRHALATFQDFALLTPQSNPQDENRPLLQWDRDAARNHTLAHKLKDWSQAFDI